MSKYKVKCGDDVYHVQDYDVWVVVESIYNGDADFITGDIYLSPSAARQVAALMLKVADELEAKEVKG